jgi:hypothetical protein
MLEITLITQLNSPLLKLNSSSCLLDMPTIDQDVERDMGNTEIGEVMVGGHDPS